MFKRFPILRQAVSIAVLTLPAITLAQLPAPELHFGHPMGKEGTLIEWSDVVRYFRRLEAASDRVRVDELGRTTEDRPFILVTIADAKTLANLDRYKQIQAGLADPRQTKSREAEGLIEQGKTVVLITCSIHSTEVASTHTAVEFAHRLLTEDTPRHRAILNDTIFLLVPSLNPDGVDTVAKWYKRYLGTPYEGAPMVELYQKYVGHDNNRDWYIFSQKETRLAVEKIHNVWRPQIVYDVHQMGSNGARMFVPPWSDPVDPNIDPLIVQQVNQMGMAMASDLTAAGKTGGASVIECCYAASCTRLSSTMTQIVLRASTDVTFCHASKRIVDEKISLNVSRRFVRPACMAGVLTSLPNFSARCGLTKL